MFVLMKSSYILASLLDGEVKTATNVLKIWALHKYLSSCSG